MSGQPEIKPTFGKEHTERRLKMYDQTSPPDPVEPKEEVKPKEPEASATPPAKPAAPSDKVEPKANEPIVPAPKPESPGDKEKKTVPLEALHESRKEIQELKKERAELTEQVKILLGDLRKLHEKPADAPKDPLPGELEYDKELIALRKEVAELKEREKSRDKLSQEEKEKQDRVQLQTTLGSVGADLEKEGFPGFQRFLPLVREELIQLSKEDREAAQALDNPEGWKKIFKEKVFPDVKGVAEVKAKGEKKEEKEKLKEDAALLTPSGTPPAPPKPDEKDEYTFDKYLEERKKRSPQTQTGS